MWSSSDSHKTLDFLSAVYSSFAIFTDKSVVSKNNPSLNKLGLTMSNRYIPFRNLPILWDPNTYSGSFLYSDQRERHAETAEEDNNPVNQSEAQSGNESAASGNTKVHGHRTIQRTQPQPQLAPNSQVGDNQVAQQQNSITPRAEGYRTSAIRESRIKDRPVKNEAKDSAVKIKIELDLEVEVDLYARVKGDVTIGLM
jgi:hypothetical protein